LYEINTYIYSMKSINYSSGQIINGLIYLKDIPPLISLSRKSRMALFQCYCGNLFETLIRSVITGNTKSCGCFAHKSKKTRFIKHGLRNHAVYKVWCGIKTRCYNKNRADYKYYGGLGITLDQEFHDFKTFFDYVTTLEMYDQKEKLKLTIDRIEVLKNYERGNLRWATRKQQSLNQRRNSGH
jgi:hypothetical protein